MMVRPLFLSLLPNLLRWGTVAGGVSVPAPPNCRGAAGERVRSPGGGCYVPAPTLASTLLSLSEATYTQSFAFGRASRG